MWGLYFSKGISSCAFGKICWDDYPSPLSNLGTFLKESFDHKYVSFYRISVLMRIYLQYCNKVLKSGSISSLIFVFLFQSYFCYSRSFDFHINFGIILSLSLRTKNTSGYWLGLHWIYNFNLGKINDITEFFNPWTWHIS